MFEKSKWRPASRRRYFSNNQAFAASLSIAYLAGTIIWASSQRLVRSEWHGLKLGIMNKITLDETT